MQPSYFGRSGSFSQAVFVSVQASAEQAARNDTASSAFMNREQKILLLLFGNSVIVYNKVDVFVAPAAEIDQNGFPAILLG